MTKSTETKHNVSGSLFPKWHIKSTHCFFISSSSCLDREKIISAILIPIYSVSFNVLTCLPYLFLLFVAWLLAFWFCFFPVSPLRLLNSYWMAVASAQQIWEPFRLMPVKMYFVASRHLCVRLLLSLVLCGLRCLNFQWIGFIVSSLPFYA